MDNKDLWQTFCYYSQNALKTKYNLAVIYMQKVASTHALNPTNLTPMKGHRHWQRI